MCVLWRARRGPSRPPNISSLSCRALRDEDLDCHNIDDKLFFMINHAQQPAELNIQINYGDDADDGDGGVFGQMEEE